MTGWGIGARLGTVWRVSRAAMLGAVASLFAWQASAGAVTVSDSTFANIDWTITAFSSGNGGTVTAGQVGSGGNPGSYRNVVDTLNSGGVPSVILGVSIYIPFGYNPSVTGAISSLNFTQDAACTSNCFGAGQSIGPALVQGGNFYVLGSSSVITGTGSAFATHTLNGLTANDFGRVILTGSTFTDNTVHPDFSASGGVIQFGYLSSNGTGPGGIGYSLGAGVDNWQITIFPQAPSVFTQVPALGPIGLGLLAIAMAALGLHYLRRQG